MLWPLINILFLFAAFKWISEMEKSCECSKDWRRTFIKNFYAIAILASFANIWMIASPNFGRDYTKYIHRPMLVLSLLNVLAAISYINKLRKDECDCSAGVQRNFIFISSIIQLGLIVINFHSTTDGIRKIFR